jgi:DNA repair exonuclease SbcCD ATPase subunit
MSYKLKTLELENFNSYLGKHEISFEENQGNLVLIKGIDELDASSNGTGKSSIVDAIVFAIYGRSLKKELNLDDLVCNKSKEPLRVCLTFVDSSKGIVKHKYAIERIRSKSPSYSKCNLFIDEELVSADLTTTETQNKIEQLLGDYQMFVNNNVLNPELFRFLKGNSAQKIDILERVLNLNIVSKIFFTLSNVAKEDQQVFSKNDVEYYALKKTLENLAQQEENVNKNVKENIEILSLRNEKLLAEIVELESQKKIHSLKIEDLRPVIEKLGEEIAELNKSKIEVEQTISEHKKRITYYEKNEICHACKQKISNRESTLKEHKEKLKECQKSIESNRREIEKLQSSEVLVDYDKTANAANECIKQINEKQYQIKNNKKTIEKFSNISSSASQLNEVKVKLEEIEVEWKDSKEKMEITDFWRELLVPKSKVRMALTGDLLKILNASVQKHINNFYSKNFSLHFFVDDNIYEVIEIEGRRLKYDQLSSGEKAKVDIVIVISLLEIAMTYFKNNKLKFLIIDEALDHLDNVWAKYVIEFIKQYAINLNMMVLFISHHSAVDDMTSVFDNTIYATKGLDGNSYISTNRVC